MGHLCISQSSNNQESNQFKHTFLRIAYRATNTLFNKLQNMQETQNKF